MEGLGALAEVVAGMEGSVGEEGVAFFRAVGDVDGGFD